MHVCMNVFIGRNAFTPERYRLEMNSAHTSTGIEAPRPTHSF